MTGPRAFWGSLGCGRSESALREYPSVRMHRTDQSTAGVAIAVSWSQLSREAEFVAVDIGKGNRAGAPMPAPVEASRSQEERLGDGRIS